MTVTLPKSQSDFNSQAGFTLVEMLVTLALLALLSTVMIGAIVQMRSMSSISERNDATLEFDALGNYLQRLISNARPLALIKNNPQWLHVFQGEPNGLRFVAVARIGSDQLALRDVEVRAEGDGDQVNLVQNAVPRRLSETPGAPEDASRTELIVNLRSVKFQYLSTMDVGNPSPPSWQDSWDEPSRLPQAVKLVMTAERSHQSIVLERTVILTSAD